MRKKGAEKIANVGNGSLTMAIEVCFSFNLLSSLILIYFLFRQEEQNQYAVSSRIGKTWQLGTCFFLFYDAHCLLTHRIILLY